MSGVGRDLEVLSSLGDLPDADDVVGVARVERLAVGRPGQRDALRDEVLLGLGNLGLELIHNNLVLQVLVTQIQKKPEIV